MTCEPGYHDCMATACEVCEEIMVWIECPTGGWWKHVDHPADDHDGEAPLPAHIDGLEVGVDPTPVYVSDEFFDRLANTTAIEDEAHNDGQEGRTDG